MITIKNPTELKAMLKAGELAAQALELAGTLFQASQHGNWTGSSTITLYLMAAHRRARAIADFRGITASL